MNIKGPPNPRPKPTPRPHDSNWSVTKDIELKSMKENIEKLIYALSYYAAPSIYNSGDVPGHIYVLDDAGYTARMALAALTYVKSES